VGKRDQGSINGSAAAQTIISVMKMRNVYTAALTSSTLEMESRKVGWGDPPLVYDEEKNLFRFRDGRFAFSRDHADWELWATVDRRGAGGSVIPAKRQQEEESSQKCVEVGHEGNRYRPWLRWW
jgi:hypothetical protein